MCSELLQQALPGSTLVVAIDPGKVAHRVWFSTGEAGLLEEPRSVSWACPALTDIRDQEPVGLREDVQHHGERGEKAVEASAGVHAGV